MNNNIKCHHVPCRLNLAFGIICCALFGLQAAFTPALAVSAARYHGGAGDGWDSKQVSPPFYQGGAEDGSLSLASVSNAVLGDVSIYIKGLGFVGLPTNNPYAGLPFSPENPLSVQLLDSKNRPYSNAVFTVTVSLANDPVGGSILGGTLSADTVLGIATFTNLSISKAGVGFTIKAMAADLLPSTSAAFNVVSLPDAPISPTGVSASDDTYTNKVRVTWTASDGATGYQIWRHTAINSGAASLLGTATSTPYDDTDAVAETTYYYWLKATNAGGASGFSSSDTGRRAPVAPSVPMGVSASEGTHTDKVRITWSAASGATGYQVWRHTANNSGAASLLGTATSTPYDDTNAVAETTYYYWLKATNSSGASAFSATASGWRAPPALLAPTGVSASDDTYTDKIRVTWGAASGATGYQVWRHTINNSGAASPLGTTVSTTYDDTGAVAGTVYYYWLKATNSGGASGFSSSDTGRRALAVAPSAPTGVGASEGTYTDKIRVTWSAASGATGYQVWRHTVNISSRATQIGTTASTTYDDTGAVAGTVYYYWLKATNSNGASGFSSSATGRRTSTVVVPSTPTGVGASDGTYADKVRVTWSAASGVTGYQVWRSASNNVASASNLGTTVTTTYDDLTAATMPGTILYYWVKAVNSAGASGFSIGDTGYVKPAIGPTIKANGKVGEITVNSPDEMSITIEMNADINAGTSSDWWVLSLAGSSWYYLNNAIQWTPFDGNLANCAPVCQAALYNMPTTLLPVLHIPGLPVNSYTFWFAVDSTMDGILNVDGQIMTDSVNVNVLSAEPAPSVKANGETGTVTVKYPKKVAITIGMNARAYAGVSADWWVLACDGASWYYLNNSVQWTPFDGNLDNCNPVNQGALYNLSSTVLDQSLPRGTYTFYFAADYPMDGILNLEQIWVDSVTVNVQ